MQQARIKEEKKVLYAKVNWMVKEKQLRNMKAHFKDNKSGKTSFKKEQTAWEIIFKSLPSSLKLLVTKLSLSMNANLINYK